MSLELMKALQNADFTKTSVRIANHCAPVIDGLKVANLLILSRDSEDGVKDYFCNTGVSIYKLASKDSKSIYYCYQKEMLKHLFCDKRVSCFLKTYGYYGFSVKKILEHLALRYQAHFEKGQGFPHELGVFLGYPLSDVEAFISHEGKDYLYCGYWKVYTNKEEALKKFSLYDESRQKALSRLLDKQAS